MGVSSSKSAVDVINEAVANAIVKSLLACSGKVVQQQSIRLSGNVSDTRIKQSAVVEISCLQNLQLTADLQSKIANAIKQASEAESIPLSGTYAESLSKIKNYVGTNLNISNIANCSASVNNRQEVIVDPGSKIKRVSLVQTANVVANCMQKALNNLKFAQGLVSTVENKSATRGSPVVAIVVILVVIILICGGGVFAYFYLENEKDNKNRPPGISRQNQSNSMMSSIAQSVAPALSAVAPDVLKSISQNDKNSSTSSSFQNELINAANNLNPRPPPPPPGAPPPHASTPTKAKSKYEKKDDNGEPIYGNPKPSTPDAQNPSSHPRTTGKWINNPLYNPSLKESPEQRNDRVNRQNEEKDAEFLRRDNELANQTPKISPGAQQILTNAEIRVDAADAREQKRAADEAQRQSNLQRHLDIFNEHNQDEQSLDINDYFNEIDAQVNQMNADITGLNDNGFKDIYKILLY